MVAKTTETKPVFPDFYQAENNCVIAVYPVAPEILRREDPALMKVPFLFYVGTRSTVAQVNESAERTARDVWKDGAVPVYFSGYNLDRMLEGTITRKGLDSHAEWPEQIEVVPGRSVEMKNLASWWVPYSFGIGHESDVKGHTKFRTQYDFDRMVNTVLPDVLAERKYMQEQAAQQAVEAAKLGNRFLALFGQYKPKTTPYEARVSVHRGWQ